MGVDSVGVDFVGINSKYECFHSLFSSIYKPEPCSCLLQPADPLITDTCIDCS